MKNIFKLGIVALAMSLGLNAEDVKIYNNTEYDVYIALVRTQLFTDNLKLVNDEKINAQLLADKSTRKLIPLVKNHYVKIANFPSNLIGYNRVLWIADKPTNLDNALKKLEILDPEIVQAAEVGRFTEVAIQGEPGNFTLNRDKKAIDVLSKTKSKTGKLPQYNTNKSVVGVVYRPSLTIRRN